jgi:hypothetical protein
LDAIIVTPTVESVADMKGSGCLPSGTIGRQPKRNSSNFGRFAVAATVDFCTVEDSLADALDRLIA